MKTNMLLDEWSASGTDFETFEKHVRMIDEATSVIPIETDDLTLLSLAGIKEGAIKLWTYNAEQSIDRQLPGLSKMSIDNIIKKGVTPEFLKDALKSKLLIRYENDIYFTPTWLSRDLGVRADLEGDAVYSATPERSAFFMHRYVTNPESAHMVVRSNILDGGRVKKIIAMPSEKYRRIPQSILLDVIAYLRKEMGKTECVRWSIEHGITQIWIEFPEKAEDVASIYKIPDSMVPGAMLETSDSGDCSFRVVATWRLKSMSYSRYNSYSHQHKGNFDIKSLTSGVKNNLFDSYIKLPERMCELLCMEIADPMAMIDYIFEHCRVKKDTLKEHLGKRRIKALSEQLELEFSPDYTYTAYDIVMRLMKLPTQYKEDTNISIGLESLVAKIPFMNFNAFCGAPSKKKPALIA